VTVSPDSIVVVGSRRGRRRLADDYSTVTAHVPADLHDRLVRLAKNREMSVSKLVRDLIRQAIVLQKK
jgi:hypothetical protein